MVTLYRRAQGVPAARAQFLYCQSPGGFQRRNALSTESIASPSASPASSPDTATGAAQRPPRSAGLRGALADQQRYCWSVAAARADQRRAARGPPSMEFRRRSPRRRWRLPRDSAAADGAGRGDASRCSRHRGAVAGDRCRRADRPLERAQAERRPGADDQRHPAGGGRPAPVAPRRPRRKHPRNRNLLVQKRRQKGAARAAKPERASRDRVIRRRRRS